MYIHIHNISSECQTPMQQKFTNPLVTGSLWLICIQSLLLILPGGSPAPEKLLYFGVYLRLGIFNTTHVASRASNVYWAVGLRKLCS